MKLESAEEAKNFIYRFDGFPAVGADELKVRVSKQALQGDYMYTTTPKEVICQKLCGVDTELCEKSACYLYRAALMRELFPGSVGFRSKKMTAQAAATAWP